MPQPCCCQDEEITPCGLCAGSFEQLSIRIDGFVAEPGSPGNIDSCVPFCPEYIHGTYVVTISFVHPYVCIWEWQSSESDPVCQVRKVTFEVNANTFGGQVNYQYKVTVTIRTPFFNSQSLTTLSYYYDNFVTPRPPILFPCEEHSEVMFLYNSASTSLTHLPSSSAVNGYCRFTDSVCFVSSVPNP